MRRKLSTVLSVGVLAGTFALISPAAANAAGVSVPIPGTNCAAYTQVNPMINPQSQPPVAFGPGTDVGYRCQS